MSNPSERSNRSGLSQLEYFAVQSGELVRAAAMWNDLQGPRDDIASRLVAARLHDAERVLSLPGEHGAPWVVAPNGRLAARLRSSMAVESSSTFRKTSGMRRSRRD